MDIEMVPSAAELSRKRAELIQKLAQQKRQEKLAKKHQKITRRETGLDILPLSFAQKRLWFLNRLSEQGAEYNISGGFSVSGQFQVQLAEEALQKIILRHEVLRTTYSESEQGPVQIVQHDMQFAISVLDYRHTETAELQSLVEQLMRQEGEKPFDLQHDFMIRANFIELPAQNGQPFGVLLFSLHHIAADGWSMEIVTKEFVEEYFALLQGRPCAVVAPEIQYGDFALWQQSHLDEQTLSNQLDFWQRQLEAVPTVHNLSLDYPRPDFKSYRGTRISRPLSAEFCTQVLAFAKVHGLTPFMLLHAVFTLVFSRCSNQTEFVVGTPAANRMKSELRNVIGFFVNTLVLKANVKAKNINAFLDHIKTVNLDAQANQDVPFEQIVERCVTSRSSQYTPLFQVLLSAGSGDAPSLALPGIQLAPIAGKSVVAKFDIDVNATINDAGGQLNWVFDSSIFKLSAIEQMADYVEAAFRSLITINNGDAALSAIDMYGDGELSALLNQPSTLFPVQPLGCSVHQHFSALAQQNPTQIALVGENNALTYQQLELSAQRIALYLHEKGVKKGDIVAVMMHRNEHLISAILAILKLGAAYLPIAPQMPAARLQFILDDAGVLLILASETVTDNLVTQSGLTIIPIDAAASQAELMNYVPDQQLPALPDLAHLPCYVIYTSGSTGTPKGVVISHRSALQFGLYMGQRFNITGQSNILQFASISFDAFVLEWQWALLNGGCLHFCDEHHKKDPLLLSQLMVSQRITHTLLPPAFLRLMPYHDQYWLEALLVGGEACDEAVAWQWASLYKTFNAYGPTESTVCASISQVQPSRPITIGKPIDKTQMFIVSPDGQVLAKGLSGELVIAGEGLALGYLNNPALTLERFPANPFAPGRWYLTGDIARQTQDDEFIYLGRIDDQVSIKGFRIELGEVKQQLLACKGVAAAEVILQQSPQRQQNKLIAYVIAEKPVALNTADFIREIKLALKSRLPDYMIPAGFAVLDAFPTTVSGKIDKNALPAIDDLALQESFQAPSNEKEQILVDIYAQLLGIAADKISVTSNFFELGGDSILSIQLVSRAARAGLHFSVKQLFVHQTIHGLVAHLSSHQTNLISQQASVGILPLLPIHQTFFSDEVDLHHFNQAVLLGCREPLSEAFLHQVIATLVAQHDALRLRFIADDVSWHGEFIPVTEYDLSQVLILSSVEDFRHIPEIVDKIQPSLDLTKGPLFRIVVFTNPAQQQRLFIVCHHLIIDGVSWRILLEDIELCLTQSLQSTPDSVFALGPKTTSFQQWCQYLEQWPDSAERAAEITYWQRRLQIQVPEYGLASDQCAYVSPEYVDTLHFVFDKTTTEKLLQQANQTYRTHINELLLAALLKGFSLWSGQHCLRVDLEGHGREVLDSDYDLSRTVGWFTTTFPLTLQASSIEVSDLICTVKEQYREVPHKGIGFGLLQKAGYLDLNGFSHAEVVFNYLGQFKQVVNENSSFYGVPEGTGRSISPDRKLTHGLNFNCKVLTEQLQCTLSYNKLRYSRASLEALNQHIVDSLHEIINHCCGTASGRFTMSDFPFAKLTQNEMMDLPQSPNIQDIYVATPMQEGMLFHSNVEQSAYANQLVMDIGGEVDLAQLHIAWQWILDRHDIFRTGFIASELGVMNQMVHQNVTLPWQELDLSGLSRQEQEVVINNMRHEDKALGFNVSQPPLVRVTVWKLAKHSYRILWTQHHALIDGWCTGIIFSELMSAYQALNNKEQPQLPQPVPFRNYIAWLSQRDYDKAAQFWREQVSQIEQCSALPFAHYCEKAALVQREYLELSPDLTHELVSLAKSTRTTLNVVVQAAWAILLSRANRTSQVTFGTTVSGRPAELAGVEGMVGLFINTIPAVLDVDPQATLAEFLVRLQQNYIARDEFSYFPLSRIQAMLEGQTQRSLFNSLFVFENYPRAVAGSQNIDRTGMQIKNLESNQGNNFPLTLIASYSDVLKLKLEYHSNYYSETGIKRLSGALAQILTSMIDSVNSPLAAVAWLSTSQQQMILQRSGCDGATARAPSFLAKLKSHIRNHPSAEAAFCEGRSVSYLELNQTANHIAHLLAEQGIDKGQRVGICLQKNAFYLAAILGVFKVGAVFVPLDSEWPKQRIDYIAKNAELRFIIVDDRSAELVPTATQPLFIREVIQDQVEYDTTLHTDDIAYVIYTSGTTGQPKGVAVSHGNISHYVDGILSRYELAEQAKFALLTSFTTDLGYTAVFLALATAGSLDIISKSTIQSGEAFVHHVIKRGINVLKLTPSLLAALLTYDEDRLPSISHVFIGGEVIQANARKCIARLIANGAVVINHYGPTETTVGACTYGIPADQSGTVPIGKPLKGMRALVLDDTGALVPEGIIGELHLSGAGVSSGYIGRSDLTAASFKADEFSRSGAELRYATGDLVYKDDVGQLVYVGRKDNQVKIRGYRVELEEIEAAMMRSSLVQAAVVLLDTTKDSLVAYVQLAQSSAPVTERSIQLKEMLRQWLPDYMIPSSIVPVTDLPLKSNGKIDKSALTSVAPELERRPVSSALERQIAKVWAKYLGCDETEIGLDDDFYNLGGDSLKMILVIGQLKKAGIQVPVQKIAKINTISGLVALLSEKTENNLTSCIVPLGQPANRLIFAIHPYGGRVENYRELAQQLRPECQLLGIQAPYNNHSNFTFNSALELAQLYVTEILATQKQGPFSIIGWSAGGTLAHLVAALLQQRGEVVAYLGLLDAAPIGFARQVKTDKEYLINSARYVDKEIVSKVSDTETTSVAQLMSQIVTSVLTEQPDFPMSERELTAALQFGVDLGRSLATAPLLNEVPAATVDVFKATITEKGELSSQIIKQAFGDRARICHIEASHSSLMQGEAVAEVAAHIKQRLGQNSNNPEGDIA